MPTTRINRIQIQVKGVSPEIVRMAMEGMSNRLLEQISQPGLVYQSMEGPAPLGAPPRIYVRIGSNTTPAELRNAIATALVGAVTSTQGKVETPKASNPGTIEVR